jgi:acyl-CoA thioester hydrolase
MTDQPSKAPRAPLPALAAFRHVHEDRLRITDLDFQHHVNNAALTTLFANARYDFLGEVVRPALPAGDKLVIASLEVTFVKEMHYGAPVFTGTRILALGRTSMRIEQAIYQEGQCAARAVSVFVHLSAQTQSTAPWPDTVQALVEQDASEQTGATHGQ